MKLTQEERSMLAGDMGEHKRWAMEHMIQVGNFFDAPDFVPISQAHMMADTESLGEAGVEFLEYLAEMVEEESPLAVPMLTDPRGIDLSCYKKFGQNDEMAERERRAINACKKLGILMTDTCINYQIIMPPVKGDHVAFGDTGVVIYSNSVLGAYTNFEGGPSALAAGFSGRTPRYGLHLQENRMATKRFVIKDQPNGLTDWGVLGGYIGRMCGSYWQIPVIEGIDSVPSSDDMKHFGAAMASFGSTPLFHIVGITPEAPTLSAVCSESNLEVNEITSEHLDSLRNDFGKKGDKIDVVVFAAPQLSLVEMHDVANLLDGKTIHEDTAVIVCTAPAVGADCDRLGITQRIESSGAMVLRGTCFYQQYAREVAEARGWKRLLSNSTKIVNIISGYGYEPALASMEDCVASAIAGEIV